MAGDVEVANVIGDDVPIYNELPIERIVQMLSVSLPSRASCGIVFVAIVIFHCGDVVPKPK